MISQKDYDFDTKWKMYESVESQVYELQETINNRVPINPQSVINQVNFNFYSVDLTVELGSWGIKEWSLGLTKPPKIQAGSLG